MIGVAFLVSTGGSKIYWGYFFARPALLREVNEIAQVNAVIPIKTESDVAGKHPIVVNDDFSLTEAIANGKRDPYYCLDERILIELERRKLLPAAHAATFVGLPELCSLVNGSGVLAKSEKGYHSTNFLRGIVVEALDRSGSRLVFLCLEGGQVSNDHYPYYETVFKRRDGSPELSFVRGQRFFYDVAGMEGAEWYSIWPFLSVFGVIAGFVLFTIARGIWSKAKRETAPRSNSESSTSPP
jgi:hypothetical protein